MISWFSDKNILNIINSFSQMAIAIAAYIAIFITLKQIGTKTKIKPKIDWEFGMCDLENGMKAVQINLHIANLGMAPIYISECGIKLWKHRYNKYEPNETTISKDKFKLEPGQIYDISNIYSNDKIHEKAKSHDKLQFYIKCHTDKPYFDKEKILYIDFLKVYEDSNKDAKQVNNI